MRGRIVSRALGAAALALVILGPSAAASAAEPAPSGCSGWLRLTNPVHPVARNGDVATSITVWGGIQICSDGSYNARLIVQNNKRTSKNYGAYAIYWNKGPSEKAEQKVVVATGIPPVGTAREVAQVKRVPPGYYHIHVHIGYPDSHSPRDYYYPVPGHAPAYYHAP